MGELFRRIHYLLNRSRLERELRNDIEVHREMLDANRKNFGNATLLQEQSHNAWGWGPDGTYRSGRTLWLTDASQSARMSLTAIAILSLGIGVNVTAFNIVDVCSSSRCQCAIRRRLQGSPRIILKEAPRKWHIRLQCFMGSIALRSARYWHRSSNMTFTQGTSQNIETGLVSGNYFRELGTTAAYGHLFSHRLMRRRTHRL